MKSDLYTRQLFSNLKGRGESVAIVGKVVKLYPQERRLLLECDPESNFYLMKDKSIATVLVPENETIDQFSKITYLEVI